MIKFKNANSAFAFAKQLIMVEVTPLDWHVYYGLFLGMSGHLPQTLLYDVYVHVLFVSGLIDE